ncbi:MAG: TonB-dependent receptor [Hyphomonas sp.]|nr:TonB-dependent receptor [Hyphomonas sp.]MCB9971080.1 TonB-dependent receptor [Hyphomonas sp.]
MKSAIRSASRTAILFGLASSGFLALAQEAPGAAEVADTVDHVPASDNATAESDRTLNKVVVTGSYIQGTPLDAALPVEVYTQQDLELEGSPTALEFAKSLTISGPTTGESYYFGGPALVGSVNYNLRGIGADKTLILLNGRRMSQNTSNIPSIALARTEVLKDGAAVIYGADATGGVVNFITRDNFTGFETNAQYKYVDGSDGDYSVGVLGGIGKDKVNFMWSAEYEHRSRLRAIDRDFTWDSIDPTDPNYNPAPWSILTNLAGWTARGALPTTPSASAAGEFGAPVGFASDFTPESCAAVGGRYDNAYTCAYNYIPYYDLVSKNDIYRGYAQLNAEVTDTMDFHMDASYGQVTTPQMFGSPSQPIIRGPALAAGLLDQFYVPISNPYATAWAADHGLSYASGFTPVIYRAIGHGGNPYMSDGEGYGVADRVDNHVFRVSAALDGELGDLASFAKGVGYDFALTYNHSNAYNTHPDIVGYRLQEALNGFGGPNCHATDLDPSRFGTQNPAAAGQGDCHWWNPFSSAFAQEPILGLSNPNYVPGSENSKELTQWLFDPRAVETVASNFTADLVFNGTAGIQLPGGEVGWALGAQWRRTDNRVNVDSPWANGTNPCPWPDGTTSANGDGTPNLESNPLPTTDPNFRGCTPDAPGPFVIFVPTLPSKADQEQYAYFAELQIPVLDSLNFQLAARHEEFSGGLGATVYKVAGKWNVWGPLTLRGSYGTNFQTPPLGVVPGAVTVGARTFTVAGNNWLAARFITASNLNPETATTWNLGTIWQSKGFAADHNFMLIVDYFDIETKDAIGQIADPNQIASLVFNGPGGTITTCDPTQQPLLNRVTFNTPCTVGMSAVGAFSAVSTIYGNGPGQTTNGFDIQATYDMPLYTGDLTLGLTATKITELKTGPTSLDGVEVSAGDDRLGYLNFATFAQAAPEWRANFSANYRTGPQNFRLGVNYVSAVQDERPGVQYGENGEDWVTADFTYRYEVSDDLSFTATVVNMFDRDPPKAQEEFGYDPWTANPLGRTIEIGVKKSF